MTTVQGLKKEYSYNKILKDLKKEFCCNGTVVQDPELGQVCFHTRFRGFHVMLWLYLILFWKPLKGKRRKLNFIATFAGYTTAGRSKEECLYLPRASNYMISFFFVFPFNEHLFVVLSLYVFLFVLPTGRYCEEGTYQDSWVLVEPVA